MMRRLLVVVLVATVLYGCGSQNSQNSDKENTKTTETKKTSIEESASSAAGAKIVFINEDSLLSRYEFAKRILKELNAKGQEVQADLASREQNLKNEVVSYQRTAGTMTMNAAKATEEQLMVKQRDLESYKRVRGNEFADEQAKLTKKLKENIQDYLKRYCEKNGFDYVLTQRELSSAMLYGSSKLDVTDDVVKGLNKEYADGKTGDLKDDKKADKKDEKKDSSKTEK